MYNVISEARKVPRSLRLFVLVNAALTVLCLAADGIYWCLGRSQHYYKPWFVGIKFNDLESFYTRFQDLHTPAFFNLKTSFPFAYPAPAALIYQAFFHHHTLMVARYSFLVVTVSIFLGAAWLFERAMERRGVQRVPAFGFTVAVVMLAFPFWFCFQRANIEIFVWLFLSLGLWAFLRDRGYTAAICFGLAVSLKMVPILYLALFIPRRQYRQILLGLSVAAVATVLSLSYIGPTALEAWRGINAGLNAFQEEFVSLFRPFQIGFDHSLVGVYRHFTIPTPQFAVLLHRYTVLTAVLGSLLWYLRIRKLPFLNQLLALVVAGIWLVPVSYEYTLLQLYLPLACLFLVLLETPRAGDCAMDDEMTRLLLLCACIVSPLSELVWREVGLGGQTKSLLLLVLMVLSLTRRLPSRFDRLLEVRRASRSMVAQTT